MYNIPSARLFFNQYYVGFKNRMGAPSLIILLRPDCAAEVLEASGRGGGGCHIFKCKGKKNILKGHMCIPSVIPPF